MSGRRIIQVLLSVSLILSGLIAAPSAEAGMSCSDTRKSTMNFSGSGRSTEALWMYVDGHVRNVYSHVERTFQTGKTTVTVIGCKNKGKWKLLSYQATQRHADLTMIVKNGRLTTIKPAGGRYQGFGIFTKRVTNSRIEVTGATCTKKPAPLSAQGVTKFLASLPIPGTNYVFSVGQFILGLVIPDAKDGTKYRCGQMASNLSLAWKFDKNGKAVLSKPKGSATTHLTTRKTQDCVRRPAKSDCWLNIDNSVVLRKS